MRSRSSAGLEQVPSKHQVGGSSPSGIAILFLSLGLAGCFKSTPPLSGTVTITPELQNQIQPQAVLYITARKEGQAGGPPAAVRRFPQPLVFPIQFKILQQDAMIPETPLEGSYSLSARIAQSGSATPVQAGDIQSTTLPVAVVGSGKSVEIMLDSKK